MVLSPSPRLLITPRPQPHTQPLICLDAAQVLSLSQAPQLHLTLPSFSFAGFIDSQLPRSAVLFYFFFCLYGFKLKRKKSHCQLSAVMEGAEVSIHVQRLTYTRVACEGGTLLPREWQSPRAAIAPSTSEGRGGQLADNPPPRDSLLVGKSIHNPLLS